MRPSSSTGRQRRIIYNNDGDDVKLSRRSDWHQDFGPWHRLDGMPEPRCIMAAVFVDDCSVAQSPLMVVPGTHRLGYLESIQPDTDRGGAAVYNLDHAVFEEVARERGIEPLIGAAGSVGFIHCNLIHGSANNVSPWRRSIMDLNYNAVSNACTDHTRAWYQNNRDSVPLEPVEDGALWELASSGTARAN